MSKLSSPIREMLTKYSAKKPVRMHMPGHKGEFFHQFYSLDITELPFSDKLTNPEGAIAQSQKLYAKTFSAKFCHYLVNGSTAGLLAVAFCSGKNVLVESNCHISVTNGLRLANKNVVKIDPDIVDGIAKPLTLDKIAEIVEKQAIDTVILTSPNYFGDVADLKSIFKYLKARSITLFVDSAHGAHFGLSKLLPDNAVNFCNATVQSCHKTLGSLTQTAVLLCNDEKLSQELKKYINLVTSTSPSYLLMLSIEDAVVSAKTHKTAFDKLFLEISRFKDRCTKAGWKFYKNDDFCRVVIDCQNKGIDARDLYNALCVQNVFCEYANQRFLIAILTPFDSGVTLDAFSTALKKADVVENSYSKNNYIDSCFNKKI